MGELLSGITVWTVLDKITCYLFVILLIWGGTCKFGKKDEFNEDFTSLDSMKSLRGFAAMGVILHHISQEYFFQEEGILSPFVNAGAYFVAIFFFCSGYGLIKSFDSKKDYLKGFIRKRIVRTIVVPFYVNILIYGLLKFIVKFPHEGVQWVTNLLGVTMMNRYAWFPIVLGLLYLVFYLCFRYIRKRPVSFVIIFIFMIAMAMLFCFEGHIAWWYGPENWWMDEDYAMNNMLWWQNEQIFWFNGEWWVNAAPSFLTGLIFASYEKKIVAFFKKKYALKLHVMMIITLAFYALNEFGQSRFGYWTEWDGNGPGIAEKIATYFCQLPLFLILAVTVFVFMMKYHVSNPVSRFFGKYSLHTYLMNLAAIVVLRFVEVPEAVLNIGDVKNNLYVYAVSVIILTVLMGVAEQKITDRVQRFLFEPRVIKDFSRPVLFSEEEGHATKVSVMAEVASDEAEEKKDPKSEKSLSETTEATSVKTEEEKDPESDKSLPEKAEAEKEIKPEAEGKEE